MKYSDLPDWEFSVDEVSNSVYKVVAIDSRGRKIEKTGLDPHKILQDCKGEAARLQGEASPTG